MSVREREMRKLLLVNLRIDFPPLSLSYSLLLPLSLTHFLTSCRLFDLLFETEKWKTERTPMKKVAGKNERKIK